MSRSLIRKIKRQLWNARSVIQAVEAICKSKMRWLKATKSFGILQVTLIRHAQRASKTFIWKMKDQLVQHLKLLNCRFFRLTRKDIFELAY